MSANGSKVDSDEVQLHARRLTTVSDHLRLPAGYNAIVTVGRTVAPIVLPLADIQGRTIDVRLECTHTPKDKDLDFSVLTAQRQAPEAYQVEKIGAYVLSPEACEAIAKPDYWGLVPLMFGIHNTLPPPRGNSPGGMLFACEMHCGPQGSAEQQRIRRVIERVFGDGFQALQTGDTPLETYYVARRI